LMKNVSNISGGKCKIYMVNSEK